MATDVFIWLMLAIAASSLSGLIILLVLLGRSNQRTQLEPFFSSLERNQEKTDRLLREELSKNREEAGLAARQGRDELSATLKSVSDSLLSRMSEIARLQKDQLDIFAGQLARLAQGSEERLEKMRETVERKLKDIEIENSQKLEQMRATVDEKLHATLEQRLGESFKLVSERLEQVHKGLGEMQTLASGVGDLKKVLTNVKARGTWGEIQLGALLEEILTPEQFAQNIVTRKGSNERVEYAVRLPGRNIPGGLSGSEVWLPIDAKFPQEDYHRLVEAFEQANPELMAEAARQLTARVKSEAKSIRDKYIDPPNTTDFAIMFLPAESLYAEVLRIPGLGETLQREYRVALAGPTTLTALLNSLQLGFRTLAIEKRSSEVWGLLGAVKTEFGKFSEILEKTHKKLQEAGNTIESAARKSRTIERRLKDVQELPGPDAAGLIGPESGMDESAD